ncbi:RagB/SusD family nutrient uptake outer membrane protein [Flexithrix dorotheae]|uniref:RagB/SusD family nutrient uptake outer membrane protein n=1 Tax=Flexithrix dorotheae TaxID=70993 RepID=UPI00036A0B33|nr:RagB/SusD family nutrient uptake outer membrane protein [Flexithrix dorotheae]
MRLKQYILGFFITTFLMVSCKPDLDLVDPNQLSPDTFFKNEVQLQSAVNAIYANLQTRGLYARHMFFMMDNMAHENAGNPQLEADKVQYLNFSFPADHGAIFQYWDNCYRGINKANFVLDNAETADGVTEATAKKNIGEAKFLRALYYFFLVTRFGDIPKYTTVTPEGQGRSPKAEIYQLIIDDLTEAASSLLKKSEEPDAGRATSGAANALLGKVHLYLGNYNEAKTAFEKVIGSGEYQLVDNFYDNFMEETEHNSETVFQVNFTGNNGGADAWGTTGTGVAEVTFRSQEYGLTWFNVYPSDNLLDQFEDGDPRYQDSFYSNGDIIDPNGTATPAEIPLGRRAAWKKYEQYYKQPSSNTESGINVNVIRYADVLLMMAEVENELGNITGAVDYLNQIRNRTSTSMPNYGTPEMNGTYPVTSKTEVFNAIVHERIVELCGEQVRFNDLLRWDMAKDVLAGTGFTVGKHELFPIPQQEIDQNEALSNADQNPGY